MGYLMEDEMAITIGRREFIALLGGVTACATSAERHFNRILYFTHSAGYRHEVIPLSQAVLKQVGENSGMFAVMATENISEFTIENLRHYDALPVGAARFRVQKGAIGAISSSPASGFARALRLLGTVSAVSTHEADRVG